MKDSTSTYEIIHWSFDSSKPSMTFETNWLIITSLIVLLLIIFLIKRKLLKEFNFHEMEIEISGSPKAVFKVERNDENLFIANRIYIELTTRKAAILIDENNDIIEEIYNSWYDLFCTIRNELKSLSGKYLKNHDSTTALIGISLKILNDGLRPHLTEHQARYRNWLEKAKKDLTNTDLSPQEIQKKYPRFKELLSSMKNVNNILIEYSNDLDKLIKGK